jgi:hypothetical protein
MEIEENACARCGRLIDVVPEGGESVDGWLMLQLAIIEVWHEEAERRGLSVHEYLNRLAAA